MSIKSYINNGYYKPTKITIKNNEKIPYKNYYASLEEPKSALENARLMRNSDRFPYTLEPHLVFCACLLFPPLFLFDDIPYTPKENFNAYFTKPIKSLALFPYHLAIGNSENKLAKKEMLTFDSKETIEGLQILPGESFNVFSITEYAYFNLENILTGEQYYFKDGKPCPVKK